VSSFTATLVNDGYFRKSTLPEHCTVINIQPEPIRRLVGEQIIVSNSLAGLMDLVPLARMLSTRIGTRTINQATSAGTSVPCRKGCGACCKYLVPLSVPEALCLGRQIGPLLEKRNATVAQGLATAANCILEGWSESRFSHDAPNYSGSEPDIESVGQWYAELGLNCPFLCDGLCTIYDTRPIACREHTVLGTSGDCDGFHPGCGNHLRMPVRVLDALAQLAARMEQTDVQAVMMPLVPFWYEENCHRELQTWPAPDLVACFLDCLAETASETAAVGGRA